MAERLAEVGVEKICVNPFQPRRQFSYGELEELAASILAVGLIHPPVVRQCGDRYELVSGERRFRAAQLAGFKKISVIVRTDSLVSSAEAALVENIQRVDLNPIEIAKALQKLMVEFGISQENLGKRVGKKRSTVTNYLRLLNLPEHIQDSLTNGEVSMGHAKALLSMAVDKQDQLYARIVKEGLSVRSAEAVAKKMGERAVSPKPSDCHLEAIIDRMQQKLGTKVTIQGQGAKGKIHIDYYSLDDLDRILEVVGCK